VISSGLTETDAEEDIDADASELFSSSIFVFILSMSRRIYQDGPSVIYNQLTVTWYLLSIIICLWFSYLLFGLPLFLISNHTL
jgi:hypothetical protein